MASSWTPAHAIHFGSKEGSSDGNKRTAVKCGQPTRTRAAREGRGGPSARVHPNKPHCVLQCRIRLCPEHVAYPVAAVPGSCKAAAQHGSLGEWGAGGATCFYRGNVREAGRRGESSRVETPSVLFLRWLKKSRCDGTVSGEWIIPMGAMLRVQGANDNGAASLY